MLPWISVRKEKKLSLTVQFISSYRAISKLPFIAKMLEKVVARHLTTVLGKYGIVDTFQSCFPKAYSTETLLSRVSSENVK